MTKIGLKVCLRTQLWFPTAGEHDPAEDLPETVDDEGLSIRRRGRPQETGTGRSASCGSGLIGRVQANEIPSSANQQQKHQRGGHGIRMRPRQAETRLAS